MKAENKNMARLFTFCRENLGWSQRTMAQQLGVNQSTISRIERGDIFPRTRLIEKLEKAMKLDLQQIISKCLYPG